MFLIPYAKLSDEQKSIIRTISRSSDDLFVSGPPGSGKTLISLYVLKDMASEQVIRPLVLIYNHSLFSYLQSAIKELELFGSAKVQTKDKYFWALAREKNIDLKDMDTARLSYEKKYDILLERLSQCSLEKVYDVTIIDEIQDMQKEEFAIVQRLSKRIVALGDFGQRVYNSDLSEDRLKSAATHLQLSKIFRFHKNIAKLAEGFSNSNSSLEHQVTRIEDAQVQIIDADNNEFQTINEIVLNLQNHKGRIGIICPNKRRLTELHEYFNRSEIKHHYKEDNKDLRNLDMTSELPLLITSYSSKGLEFEHVIVFGFDTSFGRLARLRKEEKLNDLIYVSITRTNTNLYIVRGKHTIEEISALSIDEEATEIDINDLF